MVGQSEDTGRDMDGGGFVAQSQILCSAGGELDGECVVFSLNWESWWVVSLPLPRSSLVLNTRATVMAFVAVGR